MVKPGDIIVCRSRVAALGKFTKGNQYRVLSVGIGRLGNICASLHDDSGSARSINLLHINGSRFELVDQEISW